MYHTSTTSVLCTIGVDVFQCTTLVLYTSVLCTIGVDVFQCTTLVLYTSVLCTIGVDVFQCTTLVLLAYCVLLELMCFNVPH